MGCGGGTALKCGSAVRTRWGAALPGWREGCASLLQHLRNPPGTLCRYNAGSQPSSREQLGQLGAPRCLLAAHSKCQVTPEMAPGKATTPGQGPALRWAWLRRSHPSPGTKQRWGHGELAVGNQNRQTENRDHWERDLHQEQLHRPEKTEQDLRMLH